MSETNVSQAPVAIEVAGLGKMYRIYSRPQDRIRELFSPRGHQYHHDIAALSDVSFQVHRGESVGIIGRNGSGKSTLLQVVSGVLTPTAGQVRVHGRIAALLELGAGFNMEYTGLQNIHLFGLVHGFGADGIERELDNIVAFADIGEFLYQPVKTYSSGMFVRLAFACAIHVRPDIFIVDEALAVGDLRFTQKCYKFMRDYVEGGGTLLFVSHDMGSIRSITDRVLWIEGGKIRSQGAVRRVTDEYVAFMAYGDADQAGTVATATREHHSEAQQAHWRQPEPGQYVVRNGVESLGFAMESILEPGHVPGLWRGDEFMRFDVRLRFDVETKSPVLGLACYDAKSSVIFHINTLIYGERIDPVAAGEVVTLSLRFRLPGLARGKYSFYLNVVDGDYDQNTSLCMLSGIAEFEVLPPDPQRRLMGSVLLDQIELEVERG